MSTTAFSAGAISLANLRKYLGDIISRVAFGHERTTISKNGKTVAAIVPIEDLELLERLELEEDSRALSEAIAADNGNRTPFREYLAQLPN